MCTRWDFTVASDSMRSWPIWRFDAPAATSCRTSSSRGVSEKRGVLNRELEALPSTKEVRRRLEVGEGLSGPELAVLLSWTKIVLADDLLADPKERAEHLMLLDLGRNDVGRVGTDLDRDRRLREVLWIEHYQKSRGVPVVAMPFRAMITGSRSADRQQEAPVRRQVDVVG